MTRLPSRHRRASLAGLLLAGLVPFSPLALAEDTPPVPCCPIEGQAVCRLVPTGGPSSDGWMSFPTSGIAVAVAPPHKGPPAADIHFARRVLHVPGLAQRQSHGPVIVAIWFWSRADHGTTGLYAVANGTTAQSPASGPLESWARLDIPVPYDTVQTSGMIDLSLLLRAQSAAAGTATIEVARIDVRCYKCDAPPPPR